MSNRKQIAGGILLLITGNFLTLLGLGINLLPIGLGTFNFFQDYNWYLGWLINLFEFEWIDLLIYAFDSFSYIPVLGIGTLIDLIAFISLLLITILFYIGGIFALKKKSSSLGMDGAILFVIFIGLKIFAFIYIYSSLYRYLYDPFGFTKGIIGSIASMDLLNMIDANVILIIIHSFLGAGLIESKKELMPNKKILSKKNG